MKFTSTGRRNTSADYLGKSMKLPHDHKNSNNYTTARVELLIMFEGTRFTLQMVGLEGQC